MALVCYIRLFNDSFITVVSRSADLNRSIRGLFSNTAPSQFRAPALESPRPWLYTFLGLDKCCRRKCRSGLESYASLHDWWHSAFTSFDTAGKSTGFSTLSRPSSLGVFKTDDQERPLTPRV